MVELVPKYSLVIISNRYIFSILLFYITPLFPYHRQLIQQPTQRLRTRQHLHNDLTHSLEYRIVVDGREVKINRLDFYAWGLEDLEGLGAGLHEHVLTGLLTEHVALGFVQEDVEGAFGVVVLDVGGDVRQHLEGVWEGLGLGVDHEDHGVAALDHHQLVGWGLGYIVFPWEVVDTQKEVLQLEIEALELGGLLQHQSELGVHLLEDDLGDTCLTDLGQPHQTYIHCIWYSFTYCFNHSPIYLHPTPPPPKTSHLN